MFHLTRKIDYGLLLLLDLAQAKLENSIEPRSLRDFAKSRYLSFLFLQKVAFELRQAELVTAQRGKNGGYFLAHDPKKISLKNVFEILEGPVAILHGVERKKKDLCMNKPVCVYQHGLRMLNEDLCTSLERITLHDFFTTNRHERISRT